MAGKNSGLCNSFFNLAVPSCVIPGDIGANAHFLANKVSGISLCFFETKACLAYTPADLPLWLSSLQIQWQIHLPLDLPWDMGGKYTAALCARLCSKASFLNPSVAVLHPPPQNNKKQLLAEFAAYWDYELPVVLENVAYCDIVELGENFIKENGYGMCLDVGHALGYSQKTLLDSRLAADAPIWHWSAPGNGDQHLPLNKLTNSQWAQAQSIAAIAKNNAIHVLEVFHWQGILDSIPLLCSLTGGLRGEYDI